MDLLIFKLEFLTLEISHVSLIRRLMDGRREGGEVGGEFSLLVESVKYASISSHGQVVT